jgi:hypothetical protein
MLSPTPGTKTVDKVAVSSYAKKRVRGFPVSLLAYSGESG